MFRGGFSFFRVLECAHAVLTSCLGPVSPFFIFRFSDSPCPGMHAAQGTSDSAPGTSPTCHPKKGGGGWHVSDFGCMQHRPIMHKGTVTGYESERLFLGNFSSCIAEYVVHFTKDITSNKVYRP